MLPMLVLITRIKKPLPRETLQFISWFYLSFKEKEKKHLTDMPIQHSLKRKNSSARPFPSLTTKPKNEKSRINFFDSQTRNPII